jgi:hypothetical protein
MGMEEDMEEVNTRKRAMGMVQGWIMGTWRTECGVAGVAHACLT